MSDHPAVRRLRREVAEDWLARRPALLDQADAEVAAAQARNDPETADWWLEWRATVTRLAALAEGVLAELDEPPPD